MAEYTVGTGYAKLNEEGANSHVVFELGHQRSNLVPAAPATTPTAPTPPALKRRFSSGSSVQECWLVTTIEDCRLVTKDQRGQAAIFMKWFLEAPTFLEMVEKQDVKLKGGAFDEDAGARDKRPPGERAVAIIKKNENQMMHGVRLVDAKSHVFPVNPQRIFGNLKQTGDFEPTQSKDSLCWVRWGWDDKAHEYLLSVQIVFYCVVSAPADFTRFPFDRQIVPFQLELRTFKDTMGRRQWIIPNERPQWVEGVAKCALASLCIAVHCRAWPWSHPPSSTGDVASSHRGCSQVRGGRAHPDRQRQLFLLRVRLPPARRDQD